MQKRSNPLSVQTPTEVDDSVVTLEKIALKNDTIAPVAQEEPVVNIQTETKIEVVSEIQEELKTKFDPMKIQKRNNPLTLEEKPKKKKPAIPTPDHIEGKYKKKIVLATINKTLFMTAQTIDGKKTGEILEKALLSYLYHDHPKAYEALLKSLKKNGCEIK